MVVWIGSLGFEPRVHATPLLNHQTTWREAGNLLGSLVFRFLANAGLSRNPARSTGGSVHQDIRTQGLPAAVAIKVRPHQL